MISVRKYPRIDFVERNRTVYVQGHTERGQERNEYRNHHARARLHRKRHQCVGQFLLPRFRAVDPRAMDFCIGLLRDGNRVMVRAAGLDYAYMGSDRRGTFPWLTTVVNQSSRFATNA